MQPYERIGLVALLFFGVLFAVVVLWDDGPSDDTVLAAERDRNERVDEEAAALESAAKARKAERIRLAQETVRGASLQRSGEAGQMPMGGQDEMSSDVSRVTTLSNGSDHRSAPLDLNAPRMDREGLAAARAQDPEELQDFARPNRSPRRDGAGEAVAMNARSARRRQGDEAAREETPRAAAASERSSATPSGSTSGGAKATVAANQPKARTYTVKPGDALQRIAQRELGDSSQSSTIASLNGLTDPDMIRAGMVLTLPPSPSGSGRTGDVSGERAAVDSGSGSSTSAAAAGAGRAYTIRSGESLSTALTREFGTYKRSIALVKALNPGLNPDRILAGQVIQLPRAQDVPGGAKSPAGSSTGNRARSNAPVLDTAPGTSRVASAERASTSKPSRSDSEFVVR